MSISLKISIPFEDYKDVFQNIIRRYLDQKIILKNSFQWKTEIFFVILLHKVRCMLLFRPFKFGFKTGFLHDKGLNLNFFQLLFHFFTCLGIHVEISQYAIAFTKVLKNLRKSRWSFNFLRKNIKGLVKNPPPRNPRQKVYD